MVDLFEKNDLSLYNLQKNLEQYLYVIENGKIEMWALKTTPVLSILFTLAFCLGHVNIGLSIVFGLLSFLPFWGGLLIIRNYFFYKNNSYSIMKQKVIELIKNQKFQFEFLFNLETFIKNYNPSNQDKKQSLEKLFEDLKEQFQAENWGQAIETMLSINKLYLEHDYDTEYSRYCLSLGGIKDNLQLEEQSLLAQKMQSLM